MYFFALLIAAQITGGTLRGTVSDQSGASIVRAEVTVEETATGVKRTATTNEVGAYVVPNLLPGAYAVTISKDGFGRQVKSGVIIAIGAEQALDFILGVANAELELNV